LSVEKVETTAPQREVLEFPDLIGRARKTPPSPPVPGRYRVPAGTSGYLPGTGTPVSRIPAIQPDFWTATVDLEIPDLQRIGAG